MLAGDILCRTDVVRTIRATHIIEISRPISPVKQQTFRQRTDPGLTAVTIGKREGLHFVVLVCAVIPACLFVEHGVKGSEK